MQSFPQNLQFLLNQWCKEKETDVKRRERNRLSTYKDFPDFRHFSVLHQHKLKVSQVIQHKKD